jgi:hypothetical protein
MGPTGRLIAVATALMLALGIGDAIAQTAQAPTRDEYVSSLEKVCKPGAEATRRAMKGVRADVREDRIPLATSKFGKAAKIFGHTIAKIARHPRPSADLKRLKKWFTYLNRQEDYLQEITAQLRVGHKIKAQRLTGRFIHNGNLANNVTLAFGFDFCSFKFSRYGF